MKFGITIPGITFWPCSARINLRGTIKTIDCIEEAIENITAKFKPSFDGLHFERRTRANRAPNKTQKRAQKNYAGTVVPSEPFEDVVSAIHTEKYESEHEFSSSANATTTTCSVLPHLVCDFSATRCSHSTSLNSASDLLSTSFPTTSGLPSTLYAANNKREKEKNEEVTKIKAARVLLYHQTDTLEINSVPEGRLNCPTYNIYENIGDNVKKAVLVLLVFYIVVLIFISR